MTKRERLEAKITAKKKQITQLHDEIIKLRIDSYALSDKEQWFTETKEIVGRGKNKKEKLIGRINWKEDFKDEGSGEVITIERCQVVKIDGVWELNI